jgi:hypothetical protein
VAGIENYDCDGTLQIGSVIMNRPAWMIGADESGEGGLLALITNIEQRGQDRILPTATGVIPYPRRNTATVHELRLLVVGDVDQAGADVADPTAGLVANLRYIMTNVVTPPGGTAGTRAATYTPPGGGTAATGNIHVTGLRQEGYYLRAKAGWIGRLVISIPTAALV